jgi:hypothetical protein
MLINQPTKFHPMKYKSDKDISDTVLIAIGTCIGTILRVVTLTAIIVAVTWFIISLF